MKTIRILLFTVALTAGIGGALASREPSCRDLVQYYYSNGRYYLAGVEGLDYVCYTGSEVCTYYFDTNTGLYRPCKTGQYFRVH